MKQTEKNITAHLRSLRTSGPADTVVASVKARIFAEIDREAMAKPVVVPSPEYFSGWTGFSRLTAGLSLAVFVLMFGFLVTGDPVMLRKVALETRILFASDAYDKSVLALNISRQALFDLDAAKENEIVRAATGWGQSSDDTRVLLASLNLRGEVGKYTERQCEGAYTEYYDLLEAAQKLVEHKLSLAEDAAIRQSLEALGQDIETSKQEAMARINMYPDAHN